MKKKNAIILIILSIVISSICSGIGTYAIINNYLSKDNNDSNIKYSGLVLTENDTISKGVENIYDAVVVVEGFKNNTLMSTGTGFIYKNSKDKAYIMTNHHVIEGVETVKVILSDNTTIDAKVMGSEAYSDIGVLSIDNSTIKSVAIIGNSSNLKVGDTVFTVGAPGGSSYQGTVTKGILSGNDRLVSVALSGSNQYDYYMRVLQTDAAINPGNSGGPICNINGEVIGVTNMKLVDSTIEGMGFAIPIEDALIYANTLEKGEEIKRPYLGVGMCDVSDTERLFYNRILLDEDITSGAVVVTLDENSNAYKSGLEKGDVIIELAGEKIDSIARLRYTLFKHTPGEEIELKVIRGTKTKSIKIKLTNK